MEKEIRIILLGCLCSRTVVEEQQLDNLLTEKIDWIWIVGQLLRHRLDVYFYVNTIEKKQLFVHRHINKTLKVLSDSYKDINSVNLNSIVKLFDELSNQDICFAGLKGVVYNTTIYSLRMRRSNDIDVLVAEKDLKKFDIVMRQLGFIQSLTQGETEATKKEKLIQLMNYHDLVPYYKIDGKNRIKVDVNFQFDSKENEITEEVLNFGVCSYEKHGFAVQGLRWETHLMHLCVHFYREATNSLWTDNLADVDMYKIIDLENSFRNYSHEQLLGWIEHIHRFSVERQCYYALYYLNCFFPNDNYSELMSLLGVGDTSFITEIYENKTHSMMSRSESFVERAFAGI